MTTLLGLKTEKGGESVVLASDLNRTSSSYVGSEDVLYRRQTKEDGQKIHVDDSGQFAFCMSGIFDRFYINFLKLLRSGEIDIRKAIKEGFFEELKGLNLSRWGGEVPKSDMNSLLIATRFDNKPSLYTCYPLGKLSQRACTSIGSGSDYANEHLLRHVTEIPEKINTSEGINLAGECLSLASRDIYTGGIDIVVLTPGKIDSFGDEIKRAMDSSRRRTLTRIGKRFKQPTTQPASL